jgi:hypothetical protein
MCFTVLQGYGSLPTKNVFNGESIENALIARVLARRRS